MGKDVKDFQEEMNEEELELYLKKVKTMEWLWGPDETRTVLGLLKSRKMKKELKKTSEG